LGTEIQDYGIGWTYDTSGEHLNDVIEI